LPQTKKIPQVIDLTQQQQQKQQEIQQELKKKMKEITKLKKQLQQNLKNNSKLQKQVQQLKKEKKSEASKRKLVQTQRAQNKSPKSKKQTPKQQQQSTLTEKEYVKIVKEIKGVYRKVKTIYNEHMDENGDEEDLPEKAFDNKADIMNMSAFLKFSKVSSEQVNTILDDLKESLDPNGTDLDPIEYLEIQLNSILKGEVYEDEPILLETLLGVPRNNFYNLRADKIKGFSQTRYKEFLRLRND
jgi:chromosome segregation ATPase